ncbi:MAG: aminoacyl-tRNA hydrolase, partial [Rhizobiaceae bacterium]
WLPQLLDALADNAEMLVKGEDSQLMNKLALAVGSQPDEDEKPKPTPKAPKPAGKSHIHQARGGMKPNIPATGPMADMLKKLFGDKDK